MAWDRILQPPVGPLEVDTRFEEHVVVITLFPGACLSIHQPMFGEMPIPLASILLSNIALRPLPVSRFIGGPDSGDLPTLHHLHRHGTTGPRRQARRGGVCSVCTVVTVETYGDCCGKYVSACPCPVTVFVVASRLR